MASLSLSTEFQKSIISKIWHGGGLSWTARWKPFYSFKWWNHLMENCFTRRMRFQMVSLAVTVFAYFLFFSSTWQFWQEHFAMFKLTSTYSGISGVTWHSVAAFIHWHLFLKDCLIDTLTHDKQQDCNKAHKHIHHEADMVKTTALLSFSQRQWKLFGGINRHSLLHCHLCVFF